MLTPLWAGPVADTKALPSVASIKGPPVKAILEKLASFPKAFYNKELRRQKTEKTTKSRFDLRGSNLDYYDDYLLYLVPIHTPPYWLRTRLLILANTEVANESLQP